MRLFSVEGNRQHLDGGAMFGNAPKELWQKWIAPDERNRIPLACRGFILQTDEGQTILFETGIGAFFEPKLKERYGVYETEHVLLNNLKAHGIEEKDVDVVVLSHLHFDHAGGLLSAYGQPLRLLFPKARYFVGKQHWQRAQQPHMREKASFIPQLPELLAQSGRLVLVDSRHHAELPDAVAFDFSHGHTIGLMLSEITIGRELFVFVSDLIPGRAWIHLPITMGYDRFPELLVDEKERFYPGWVKKSAKLLFTHDPTVPCALLVQEAEGKYKTEPFKLPDAFPKAV